MRTKDNHTNRRPKPPDDLDGEALLEWHRITDELAAHDLLDAADRAILTIYVRTWAAWNAVALVVAVDGPIVLLPNNWPGQSPEYKTMSELGKTLDKLIASLGLTPSARTARTSPQTEDDADDAINY